MEVTGGEWRRVVEVKKDGRDRMPEALRTVGTGSTNLKRQF